MGRDRLDQYAHELGLSLKRLADGSPEQYFVKEVREMLWGDAPIPSSIKRRIANEPAGPRLTPNSSFPVVTLAREGAILAT